MLNSYLQDIAALAMIERSADAWKHNQFKDVIVRAANVEMDVFLFEVTHAYSCSVVTTRPSRSTFKNTPLS
jgi:hypothetical protein